MELLSVGTLLCSISHFLEQLVAWNDRRETDEVVSAALDDLHEAVKGAVQCYGHFNLSFP